MSLDDIPEGKKANRWWLLKATHSVCPECDKPKTEFMLSPRRRYYFGMCRDKDSNNPTFTEFTLRDIGDSGAYVCEHGKVCRIYLEDFRGFKRYPYRSDMDKAKEEMGHAS